MSELFNRFKDRLRSPRRGEGPGVYLGVFGKHPGWPEHIEGFAERESIVDVKRLLYQQGINRVIDSGEWEKLDAASGLVQFDHALLWWMGGSTNTLVAARVWASSDFKGRERYPMIACCACESLSPTWVARVVLPELARLQGACMRAAEQFPPMTLGGTESSRAAAQDAVREAMTETEAELQIALKTELAKPMALPSLSLAELSRCAELVAPNGEAGDRPLLNLLHHVERQMTSFTKSMPTSSKTMAPRPQQARVPAGSDDPDASAELWLRFALERVDSSWPVLVAVSESAAWADLFVGEPSPRELRWLRISPDNDNFPLTTSIPYELTPEFIATARTQIAAAQSQSIVHVKPTVPAPSNVGPSAEVPPAPQVTTTAVIATQNVTDAAPPVASITPAVPVAQVEPVRQPELDTLRPPATKPAMHAKRRRWWLPAVLGAGVLLLGIGIPALFFSNRREIAPAGPAVVPATRPSAVVSHDPGIDPPTVSSTVTPDTDPRLGASPKSIVEGINTVLKDVRDKAANNLPAIEFDSDATDKIATKLSKLQERAGRITTLDWALADDRRSLRDVWPKFQQDANEVRAEVKLLAQKVDESVQAVAGKVREYQAAVPPDEFKDPMVRDAWTTWRDKVVNDFKLNNSVSQFYADRDMVDNVLSRIQKSLNALDAPSATMAVDDKSTAGRVRIRVNEILVEQRASEVKQLIDSLFADLHVQKVHQEIDQKIAVLTKNIGAGREVCDRLVTAVSQTEQRLNNGWGVTKPNDLTLDLPDAFATDTAIVDVLKPLQSHVANLKSMHQADRIAAKECATDTSKDPDLRIVAVMRWLELQKTSGDASALIELAGAIDKIKLLVADRSTWPEEARRNLQNRIDAQRIDAWCTLATHAPTDSERGKFYSDLDDARDELHVGDDIVTGLPDPVRFNLSLSRLLVSLADVMKNTDAIQDDPPAVASLAAARDKFLTLAPNESNFEPTKKVSASLNQLLSGTNSDQTPLEKRLLNKIGDSHDTITYEWKEDERSKTKTGRRPLKFIYVKADKPFYLLATETPAWLASAVLRSEPAAAEKLLSTPDEPKLSVWKRNSSDQSVFVNESLHMGTTDKTSAENYPMQQIGPQAAVYVASRLGMRLPTYDEWHAAINSATNEKTLSANLCDLAWSRAKSSVNKIETKGFTSDETSRFLESCFYRYRNVISVSELAEQAATKPNDFWSAEMVNKLHEKWGTPTQADDSSAWLRPTPEVPDDAKFQDLIGNVAEWVINSKPAERPSAPARNMPLEMLYQWSRDRCAAGELAVVGWSALAPPSFRDVASVNIKSDAPFEAVQKGWPDVGFRLAFDAPYVPLGQRIHDVMKTLHFQRVGNQ